MQFPSCPAEPRSCVADDAAPPTTIVIAPNGSLSTRGAWGFVGAIGLPSVASGVWLSMLGYWPVLLATLAVMTALVSALRASRVASRYCEVLTLTDDHVRIERGIAGVGPLHSWQLPRAWARVAVCSGGHCNWPMAVYLQASGRRVRIAQCLTDDEREALAARLRQWLAARPKGPGERTP